MGNKITMSPNEEYDIAEMIQLERLNGLEIHTIEQYAVRGARIFYHGSNWMAAYNTTEYKPEMHIEPSTVIWITGTKGSREKGSLTCNVIKLLDHITTHQRIITRLYPHSHIDMVNWLLCAGFTKARIIKTDIHGTYTEFIADRDTLLKELSTHVLNMVKYGDVRANTLTPAITITPAEDLYDQLNIIDDYTPHDK
jgi:hypothetical protein